MAPCRGVAPPMLVFQTSPNLREIDASPRTKGLFWPITPLNYPDKGDKEKIKDK